MKRKAGKKEYSTTYKIYRRLRFLRYKKKILKKQIKERKKREAQQAKLEEKERKARLKQQRRIEREETKKALARAKREREEEKRLLAEQVIEEPLIPKITIKNTISKEEKEQEEIEFKKRLLELRRIEKENIAREQQIRKEQKKYAKKRRRRLLKVFIKRSLFHFWIAVRTLTPVKVKEWLKQVFGVPQDLELKRNFYSIFLNSLSLFLLSYFIIFLFGQLIRIFFALGFDYQLILFYNKLYFDISVEDWSMDSVKILYSTIPFVGLLTGVIFLIMYGLYSRKGTKIRLFYLWGTVHGVNAFFGALFFGTLLEQGFGWVISYMYYMDTGKMVYSFIGLFALVSAGTLLAKSFYQSAQHYFGFIDDRNKKYFLNSQIVLPVIIGVFIIAVMKIPSDFYFETFDEMWFDILKSVGVYIIALPLVGMIRSFGPMYFGDEDSYSKITVDKKLLLYSFGLVILLRLLLHFGVHIG
jgi:hypothetical protein